jgi:hypothetical protein
MAAVVGTVYAGVDLLLQDLTTALAFDFDHRLVLLGLVEEVDAGLSEGIH